MTGPVIACVVVLVVLPLVLLAAGACMSGSRADQELERWRTDNGNS